MGVFTLFWDVQKRLLIRSFKKKIFYCLKFQNGASGMKKQFLTLLNY